MISFDFELFLGFAQDPLFENGKKGISPYWSSLLTKGGDYLSEIEQDGVHYLGKFTSPHPTLEELENLESNVLSLLQRLVPHYPFRANPPILLTLPRT